MKLFWRVLALIWAAFKISGLNLPTFSFLFNKPRIKFHNMIVETLHGDLAFTIREQKLILEAAKDMHRFTNGRVLFRIKFDLNSNDNIYNRNVVLKITSDEELIQKQDKHHEANVLGLYYHRNNGTKSIYMITDRLNSSDNMFRTTMIHELGHYLGMGHTEGCSIMHKHNSNIVPYPTLPDAKELAKIWKCLPTDLSYFKL